MSKFKVGDMICLVNNELVIREVLEVVQSKSSSPQRTSIKLRLKYFNLDGSIDQFETDNSSLKVEYQYKLVDPPLPLPTKEQAIAVLVDAGYTITPPKPKLTGKAVIWYFNSLSKVSYHTSDIRSFIKGIDKTIIALVDWTEGEGLPNKE